MLECLLFAPLFLAPPPAVDEEVDLRDVVLLEDGDEVRGRLIERYRPDEVVLLRGDEVVSIPREDVARIGRTTRDALRTWLRERVAGLSVDEEWALVARAQELELPGMARVQAWHVLTRDPLHAGAHELLGHEQRRGEWRWRLGDDQLSRAEFDETLRDFGDAFELESEHWTLRTNTDVQSAVDTIVDLERAYVLFLDRLGAELGAAEDARAPEQRMVVQLYRERDDPDYTQYLTGVKRPYYSPTLDTTDRYGNPNVLFTFYEPNQERPEELFELAVQQLLYTTMVFGRIEGGAPRADDVRLSHWVELGLGHWLGGQLAGAPGYAHYRSFDLSDRRIPELARTSSSGRTVLDFVANELKNLVGLAFPRFYSTGTSSDVNRAKAKSFFVFLMEENPEIRWRNDVVGHGRQAMYEYLRQTYGTPRGHSSSALDDALGAPVESLEDPWRQWLLTL